MHLIMLRHVPSRLPLLRVFIFMDVEFHNCFSESIDVHVTFIPRCVIVNHVGWSGDAGPSWHPWSEPPSSWCRTFFLCCWVRVTHILLRFCICASLGSTPVLPVHLYTSFLWCSSPVLISGNLSVKLSVPEFVCWGVFDYWLNLLTLVFSAFRFANFTIESWSLYVSREVSIFSRLSNLFAYNSSQ